MNFFKRAKVSITRRPGKTIILLILVFILGSVIAGAISIERAVHNTDTNLRRNLPPFVSLERDWDAIQEEILQTGNMPELGNITADLMRQISELPYVDDFDYSIFIQLQSFDLEAYAPEGSEMAMGVSIEGWPRTFSLMGVEKEEVLHIEAGVIELVEGRSFTETELNMSDAERSVALISQGLAEANHLQLGSTFSMDGIILDEQAAMTGGNFEENIFAQTSYEFEVVGIFTAVEQRTAQNETADPMAQIRQITMGNRIYVPNQIAEIASRFQLEQRAAMLEETGAEDLPLFTISQGDEPEITSIFILNDPLEVEAFRAAVEPMLPDFIIMNDLSNTFADISTSMETLTQIAGWILWAAVGTTLLILSLLITLFLRDRRHEMGIYLALGEKKSKIILQILLEIVVTSFIGITLAVFSGHLVSSAMSQTMLRNELAQASEPTFDIGSMIGAGGLSEMAFSREMTADEMLDAFDVSLDAPTIMIFYGTGLGSVVISTLIPVVYIVKLNPKKVLM